MHLFSEYDVEEEIKDRKIGCKFNPTIDEMVKDLDTLYEIKDWHKYKVGYGIDSGGIVRRIVVTADSKKFDDAKDFCVQNRHRFIPLGPIEESKISEILGFFEGVISNQRRRELKYNKKILEEAKAAKAPVATVEQEQEERNMKASESKVAEVVETEVAPVAHPVAQVQPAVPEITEDMKKIMLTSAEGYAIYMQIARDPSNLTSKGILLYVVNKETGLPMLGKEEIKIAKAKLMAATDHGVMEVLRKFAINLSEDNLKQAFERAKRYIEISKRKVQIPESKDIIAVFRDLLNYSITEANAEILNKEIAAENLKYKLDMREGSIAIRDNHIKKVLEEIDSGFTTILLCKKLRILETHLNKQVIITNRSGGVGYGFNDSNNIRYYKFKIMDFNLSQGEVA